MEKKPIEKSPTEKTPTEKVPTLIIPIENMPPESVDPQLITPIDTVPAEKYADDDGLALASQGWTDAAPPPQMMKRNKRASEPSISLATG